MPCDGVTPIERFTGALASWMPSQINRMISRIPMMRPAKAPLPVQAFALAQKSPAPRTSPTMSEAQTFCHERKLSTSNRIPETMTILLANDIFAMSKPPDFSILSPFEHT